MEGNGARRRGHLEVVAHRPPREPRVDEGDPLSTGGLPRLPCEPIRRRGALRARRRGDRREEEELAGLRNQLQQRRATAARVDQGARILRWDPQTPAPARRGARRRVQIRGVRELLRNASTRARRRVLRRDRPPPSESALSRWRAGERPPRHWEPGRRLRASSTSQPRQLPATPDHEGSDLQPHDSPRGRRRPPSPEWLAQPRGQPRSQRPGAVGRPHRELLHGPPQRAWLLPRVLQPA